MNLEHDLVTYSKYAEGVAYPVRMKIQSLLLEKGSMYQSEIVKQLRGTEFEKEFRTIQTHLKKMESCGLVEIIKDKKDLTIVVPKKIVKIDVEDI